MVIDEAHVFAPEKGQSEAMGAVIDLATRGRKRGYCAVLATQRLSKLHKDAAAECNNKLIGRTGLDIDRKRAAEELGFTSKEATLALRQLEPGEFFAFGPAISPEVTKVQISAVSTSHPKAGDRILTEPTPPTAHIKSILSKLAGLPEEAVTEAKTIEAVQAQNRQLRHELTLAQQVQPAPNKEQIDKAVAEALAHKERLFTDERKRYEQTLNVVQEKLAHIAVLASGSDGVLPPTTSANSSVNPQQFMQPLTEKPLPQVAMQILHALASRYPMTLTTSQLATHSKLLPLSSIYGTYLSMLELRDFIRTEGNSVRITQAGLTLTGVNPPKPQTQEQVISMWQESLPQGAKRMLDILVSIHPATITKHDLGREAKLSSTSGTFTTYLSMLRSNELIEITGTTVKASDNLFVEHHTALSS